MAACVDLCLELRIKIDPELLSILLHIVKCFDTLENCLVLVDMLDTLHEVLNLQLFLELQMRYFGLVKQLNVNIGLSVLNVSQNLVEILIVVGVNGLGQLSLCLFDGRFDIETPADWSLLFSTVLVFVDPVTD